VILLKPRALRAGATFGVVAPAFAVDCELLDEGIRWLRSAGFEVRCRDDLRERCGYLAGDDARRADELMQMVLDPEVDAIVCARAGYGCQRILPRLDAEAFRSARKPLLGYSDTTSLQLWMLRCAGLTSFHAPMLEHGAWDVAETEAVRAALAGERPPPWVGVAHGGGRAEGPLIGGSLTLLAASLGTPWELETDGALLLFEEVAEKPYAIDRLLHQLSAAGKLDGVAGVGVGHLIDCIDPKRAEPTALEVVREILEPRGIPLVSGLPFGHGRPNLPWPVGARAALDGQRGELVLLDPGVES
jgi:muramoyltetrapeptide carboxypeptidase